MTGLVVVAVTLSLSLPVGTASKLGTSVQLLALLAEKGVITIDARKDKLVLYAYIEPGYWQDLTAVEKQQTVQALMSIAYVDTPARQFVMVLGRVDQARYAVGYLSNGSVEILK